MPLDSAEVAGAALGRLAGEKCGAKLTIDAMVMAFAATYGGGLVYTSDADDAAPPCPPYPRSNATTASRARPRRASRGEARV